MPPDSHKMSALERKSSAALAFVFSLRMLGVFLILPVFALYAKKLPGAADATMIGLALGAYGLTQALLQLPFGIASDRFGRKPLIYIGLLLMTAGSLIAAMAPDIRWLVVGRAIQGSGAISAAVTALLADLTREEQRTKAMAMIGASIGVTFSASLVVSPALQQWVGVPGIFELTGLLSLAAIAVVKFVIPNPEHTLTTAQPGHLKMVLHNVQLLRLNYGIFALHAAQIGLFMTVPFALRDAVGLPETEHWQVYLPIMVIALLLVLPVIILGERKARIKLVFLVSIGLMLAAQLLFALLIKSAMGVLVSLLLYFVAFNALESLLPSLVSKIAPPGSRGTAMGVYNTSQSVGIFVGGVGGGALAHHFGFPAVFLACSSIMAVWLIWAASMSAPQ